MSARCSAVAFPPSLFSAGSDGARCTAIKTRKTTTSTVGIASPMRLRRNCAMGSGRYGRLRVRQDAEQAVSVAGDARLHQHQVLLEVERHPGRVVDRDAL